MTEHIADWTYYTQALAVSWHVKAGIAAVAAWFSTEPALIYWLVAMWCADLFFGLWEAFRRGRFSCRVLKRGALKIPAYCLYVVLVAAVDTCRNWPSICPCPCWKRSLPIWWRRKAFRSWAT